MTQPRSRRRTPPTLPPHSTSGETEAAADASHVVGGRISRVEQNTRIEQPMRIERVLCRTQRRSKEVGGFSIVPWPVIAADRVVVGDRAACVDQRVARGALDRPPLGQQIAV